MPVDLTVTISDELMSVLERWAAQEGSTPADLASGAVFAHYMLEPEELSSEARAKYERGMREAEQGLTIPHEEIEAWLESLGTDHEIPRPQSRSRAA